MNDLKRRLLGIFRSAIVAASISLAFLSDLHAEITRFCMVSYVGKTEVSTPVTRKVTFATGRELNLAIDKIEFSTRFDPWGVYAVLWFAPGEVAIAQQYRRAPFFRSSKFEREDFRMLFLIDQWGDFRIVNGHEPNPGAFRIHGKVNGIFVDPGERP